MGTITAQVQLTEAELKLLQTLVYQECGMFSMSAARTS